MITQHEARTALDLMRTQPDALEPDGDEGCDYTLTPGRTAWITVHGFSVYLTPTSVAIYECNHEDEPALAVIDFDHLEVAK